MYVTVNLRSCMHIQTETACVMAHLLQEYVLTGTLLATTQSEMQNIAAV